MKQLYLDDTHDENILLDLKENIGSIVCIDCDTWHLNETADPERCYKYNLGLINATLSDILLEQDSPELMEFIILNSNLKDRYQEMQFYESTEMVSFYKDLVDELSLYTHQKINTLGQLKRVLK